MERTQTDNGSTLTGASGSAALVESPAPLGDACAQVRPPRSPDLAPAWLTHLD
jgi:hypothetical protein